MSPDMNKKNLTQFLVDSNAAGYAGGEEKKWIKETDGSTTIPFEKGQWKSHDNFFGGEPYGGRTVVFYKSKPVWIMVYYGRVVETADPDEIYKTLREALMRMPKDHPYRGPKEYTRDGYVYTNVWKGDVDNFSGEESIRRTIKIVYQARYMGGFVDLRRGV